MAFVGVFLFPVACGVAEIEKGLARLAKKISGQL